MMTAASQGKVVVFSGAAAPGTGGKKIVRSGTLTRDMIRLLEQEIRNAAENKSELIIDLRGVKYGDEGGLEALATLFETMKAEGRKLDWQCSDGKIANRLRRCGVLTVFQGYGQYL
jgi:anti-anti-sigma regulatory factor